MSAAAAAGESPPEPRIVVISGPSGVGKTTLVQRLLTRCPLLLVKSISATTRPPRPAEVDGVDYHFMPRSRFERLRDNGDFLEWAEVHRSGFLYGTLWSEVERAREAAGWSLLEIDVEGMRAVRERYPRTVTIFLSAGSIEEFERRLRGRGTESEETIRRRLETARRELASAGEYRHHVINDSLDRAAAEIGDILFDAETAG